MKESSKRLFVVGICSAFTVGASLLAIMLLNAKAASDATITIDKEGSTSLSVSLNDMAPGKEFSYSIAIKGSLAKYCAISLRFEPGIDLGTLSESLTLTIDSGSVYESLAFSKALSRSFNLGKGTRKIKLSYLMDEEAGNEFQGAYANFNAVITAETRGK